MLEHVQIDMEEEDTEDDQCFNDDVEDNDEDETDENEPWKENKVVLMIDCMRILWSMKMIP